MELSANQLDEIRTRNAVSEAAERVARWGEPHHDASPFINAVAVSKEARKAIAEAERENTNELYHFRKKRQPKVSHKVLP